MRRDSGHEENSGIFEIEGDEADFIRPQRQGRHGSVNVDDNAIRRGIETTVERAKMIGRFHDDFVADTILVKNVIVFALMRLIDSLDGARRQVFAPGDVRRSEWIFSIKKFEDDGKKGIAVAGDEFNDVIVEVTKFHFLAIVEDDETVNIEDDHPLFDFQ